MSSVLDLLAEAIAACRHRAVVMRSGNAEISVLEQTHLTQLEGVSVAFKFCGEMNKYIGYILFSYL